MRIYISIIILCLLGGNAFAQNFQRNYPLQNFEQSLNIAGIQLSDNSYASMDGILLTDSTYRNIIITNFDKKGSLIWSRQVFFTDGDSIQTNITGGSLIQGDNDSLYFTATLFRAGDLNKFVGAIDAKGNSGWGKILNDNTTTTQSEQGFNKTVNYIDSSFLQVTSIGLEDTPDLYLNQIGYDGSLRRSSKIKATFDTDDVAAFVSDIEIKKDSSIMMVGALNNSGTYFLNVLDKDWNPKITKTFGDNVNFFSIYVGLDVKETPDTGYVVTGQFINLNLIDIDSSYIGSFVSKHDSLGEVVWSKRLNIDNMANITNGIVVNSDGSIMVAANIVDGSMSNSLISRLDANGNQQWVKLYNMVNVPLSPFGGFQATNDGGYAFFTSAIIGDTISALNLIKTDSNGSTTCEDTLTKIIFEDIPLLSLEYELTLTDSEDLVLDEYTFRADNFGSYAIVDVSLESETFCPNEQINFLLDANVEGATSYLWNTGATTDTLRVFDDEQYTVIVTIGEGVCYTLCDTVAMNRYDLPMASATYNCDNGEYNLFVSAVASAGVDSVVWSTGEKNVNQIRVTEQGAYTVTVTDACGETAEALVNVDPPAPIFTPAYVCRPTGIFLISQFNPALTKEIKWSTGAQDDGKHEVMITDKKIYSVTLTDICNETIVKEVNFNPSMPTVTVNGVCTQAGIMLTANVSNNTGILEILWSTGAQDNNKPVITVPSIGTYSVTITDFCRETVSAIENFNPTPIQVNPTLGDCSPQGQVVNSNVATGQFVSILWSTGAQDDNKQSVTIPVPGVYTVTLTDLCRLTSTATITVPVLPDMLTITADFSTACNNGPVTLTATANGTVSYKWDTGDSTNVLKPFEIGTYSVTATDGCGNELVESITFNEGDLPIEVTELNIQQDNSDFCVNNTVKLNAAVSGSLTGLQWSTGESVGEITVPVNGQTITLTAFDECGNEIREKIISVNGDSSLSFAKIFFPSDFSLENPENAVFGGYVSQVDTLTFQDRYDAITDFEMHIFNRWGQEVFMSKDVEVRWNGYVDNNITTSKPEDNKAKPEVYIWYATYTNPSGCLEERKGDVTLFR